LKRRLIGLEGRQGACPRRQASFGQFVQKEREGIGDLGLRRPFVTTGKRRIA
jgi:hypothetical protein